MELIFYGTASDKKDFPSALPVLPEWHYRDTRVTDYPEYDSFIAGLDGSPPDGMEGVIAA